MIHSHDKKTHIHPNKHETNIGFGGSWGGGVRAVWRRQSMIEPLVLRLGRHDFRTHRSSRARLKGI